MIDTVDLCHGGGAFYLKRHNPRVVCGDIRRETITVTDRSHGNASGKRVININPNVIWDFRSLPFADETFHLAVFDPPHFTRAGQASFMAARYGLLSGDWRTMLTRGFSEAFRVLKPSGVLNFKWNDTQVLLSEILPLAGKDYLYGQKSGRGKTHWLIFVK